MSGACCGVYPLRAGFAPGNPFLAGAGLKAPIATPAAV